MARKPIGETTSLLNNGRPLLPSIFYTQFNCKKTSAEKGHVTHAPRSNEMKLTKHIKMVNDVINNKLTNSPIKVLGRSC